MTTRFPRFTRGQFGRLTYGDMNRIFDLLNELEAAVSGVGVAPSRIPHSTRWMARIDDIDTASDPAKHAGHEVRRIGEQWEDVPGGKLMELDGTGDTVYATNRASYDNVPQQATVGQIVEVEDRYDSENVFVRDFYATSGGAGTAQVLVGTITASTVPPNSQPVYSAESCDLSASIGPLVPPIDRQLPADLFDYQARPVGAPCLILQCFPPEGGPPSQWLVAFEHVLGTACPADEPPQALDGGGEQQDTPRTADAMDLYLASTYR